MRLLNGIANFFHKLFRFFVLLLIILLLGIVIKWQVDAIYIKSTTRSDVNFSLIDEIVKTKNDIISFKNGEPINSTIPVVEEKEKDQNNQNTINITITENSSVDEIGELLLNNRLIQDVEAFKVMVNDMGLYNSFVAGTYQFKEGNKILDTLMQLTNSTYKEYDVSVAQGDNSATIGKKLEVLGAIQSAEAFDQQCKSLGVENSFQPGSYTIATPSKVVRIIEKLTGQQLETN